MQGVILYNKHSVEEAGKRVERRRGSVVLETCDPNGNPAPVGVASRKVKPRPTRRGHARPLP